MCMAEKLNRKNIERPQVIVRKFIADITKYRYLLLLKGVEISGAGS
jgi:hypothetical protein